MGPPVLIAGSDAMFRPSSKVSLASTALFVLVAEALTAPDAVHAQSVSSRSSGGPSPGSTAPPAAENAAGAALFRQRCVKCHGTDGTGGPGRERTDKIPNFTDASWQKKQSDEQLLNTILDGKEPDMPSWRAKIAEEQARGLVAYIRGFARMNGTSEGSSHDRFKERFRTLKTEFEALQKKGSALAEAAPGKEAAKPSESPQQGGPRASAPPPTGGSDARALFGQKCAKCHGEDGTGKPKREEFEQIPNFTNPSWQKKRSDARLLASILDGKEPDMPSWRKKISEEQARGLVAYIRAFASTRGSSESAPRNRPNEGTRGVQEDSERSTEGEHRATRMPQSPSETLIVWLGTFHPPSVHFPIALLTAAAVAELLRITTGHLAFDAVTRVLVWFGTITAVVAGVLGWFLAGFRLTDPSRLMMMHRWLGTTTVGCAGLLLVLSEMRRPGRHLTRLGFRVMLLLVAVLASVTGYVGGAMVFGLDYHDWPK
jgi:mono/diheme cytochrome c family protein/uncharacterized membrane protein